MEVNYTPNSVLVHGSVNHNWACTATVLAPTAYDMVTKVNGVVLTTKQQYRS